MIRTYKGLSALLSYPKEELQQAMPELQQAIESENLVPADLRRQLQILIEELATGDIYDLQERYVLLFDRTRSLSLHLFEHVHGESRDRGQAMIDLKSQYEQHGLFVAATELPDFLPLFLEFLCVLPPAEAANFLGQPVHIFAALAERLRKRRSAYEAVFRTLTALAETKPSAEAVEAVLKEPDADASDLAALDAQWEEEAVTFGPSAAPNCKDQLIARIRAGRRPAAGLPA